MNTQPAPPAAIATMRTALDKATLVDDNPAYILGKLLDALRRDGWQIVPAGQGDAALLARVRELEAAIAAVLALEPATNEQLERMDPEAYQQTIGRDDAIADIQQMLREAPSGPTRPV